jgi:hypothetical protein
MIGSGFGVQGFSKIKLESSRLLSPFFGSVSSDVFVCCERNAVPFAKAMSTLPIIFTQSFITLNLLLLSAADKAIG